MLTNLELTTVKQTGVLGKIAVALVKKGFKITGQAITDLDDNRLCLIKFGIETQQECSENDFDFLSKEIPQVIKINGLATKKEISQPEKKIDGSDLISNLGNQLINKYPDILPLLKKIDYSLSVETRQDVLSKLGRGIGRWHSKNKFSRGSRLSLDKTLQRMLCPSLKKFLDIEYSNKQVIVNNCPHCYQQEDHKPGCYFITAYIQGFLDTFTHLPATTVNQLHSKANGFENCIFEIRLAKNN